MSFVLNWRGSVRFLWICSADPSFVYVFQRNLLLKRCWQKLKIYVNTLIFMIFMINFSPLFQKSTWDKILVIGKKLLIFMETCCYWCSRKRFSFFIVIEIQPKYWLLVQKILKRFFTYKASIIIIFRSIL